MVEQERGEKPSPHAKYVPGQVFHGKYRIERVLGSGGMGVVLAATHLKLDQHVAIKVVLPELAGNPEVTERFLREGRAAVKIRSEHVARVMDVESTEDGTPYMVMEYLEGSDLAQALENRGPLPLDEAVGHVLQACEAVAQAHSRGIVHRDLKPANLFLTTGPDGQPCIKVLDFGISKVSPGSTISSDHSLTKTSSMMGSPTYMAPEQMRSTRNVDARADVWALGTILYELLSGKSPFTGTTLADLLATILQDTHAPIRHSRPDVPEAIDTVVAKCLEKDPERRYPSVAELAGELERFGPPWANVSVARIRRTLGSTPRPSNAETTGSPLSSSAEIAPSREGETPPLPLVQAKTAGAWTAAPPARSKGWPRGIVLGGAAAGLLALIGLGVLAAGKRTPPETLSSTTAGPLPGASTEPRAVPPATNPSHIDSNEPSALPALADPRALPAGSAAPSSPHNDAGAGGSTITAPQKPKAKPASPTKSKKTTVDDRHG